MKGVADNVAIWPDFVDSSLTITALGAFSSRVLKKACPTRSSILPSPTHSTMVKSIGARLMVPTRRGERISPTKMIFGYRGTDTAVFMIVTEPLTMLLLPPIFGRCTRRKNVRIFRMLGSASPREERVSTGSAAG